LLYLSLEENWKGEDSLRSKKKDKKIVEDAGVDPTPSRGRSGGGRRGHFTNTSAGKAERFEN
jgi:hypothetical protein